MNNKVKKSTLLLFMIFLAGLILLQGLPVAFAAATNTSTSTSNTTNREITSKGCGEGWGYYIDDSTPFCEPIDKIGQGRPDGVVTCAALGCPYNPPDLSQENPELIKGITPCWKNNEAGTGIEATESPINKNGNDDDGNDSNTNNECPEGFYCIDDPIPPDPRLIATPCGPIDPSKSFCYYLPQDPDRPTAKEVAQKAAEEEELPKLVDIDDQRNEEGKTAKEVAEESEQESNEEESSDGSEENTEE